MTLADMKKIKAAYGISNRKISEETGVPFGTVQKIFGGVTETPRYDTLITLSDYFNKLEGIHDEVGEYHPYNTGSAAENMTGKNIDDYMALPEGTRIEMIDGVFYDMAAPTIIHQRIAAMIFNALENHVNKSGGPCIPMIAPTDVQLDNDDKTMVQPDVLVVCDRKKIIKARVLGAPDLIIEVLSPSNWYIDTFRKLRKYKNAGVREYWIVLPEQKCVQVYEFEKSAEPVEYSFAESIPVSIWDGKCNVDFKEIYEKVEFLYNL